MQQLNYTESTQKLKLPDNPNIPPELRHNSRPEDIIQRCDSWFNPTKTLVEEISAEIISELGI